MQGAAGEWYPLPSCYHVSWTGSPFDDRQTDHQAGRLTYNDCTGREAGTVTRVKPVQPSL